MFGHLSHITYKHKMRFGIKIINGWDNLPYFSTAPSLDPQFLQKLWPAFYSMISVFFLFLNFLFPGHFLPPEHFLVCRFKSEVWSWNIQDVCHVWLNLNAWFTANKAEVIFFWVHKGSGDLGLYMYTRFVLFILELYMKR